MNRDDNESKGPRSMKRAFVFLMCPILLAFMVWWSLGLPESGFLVDTRGSCAGAVFLFTMLVSAIAGPLDAYLAETSPTAPRAVPTAIAGAAIADGLLVAWAGTIGLPPTILPHWIWLALSIGGALCMGTCSLLSIDRRDWKPASALQ